MRFGLWWCLYHFRGRVYSLTSRQVKARLNHALLVLAFPSEEKASGPGTCLPSQFLLAQLRHARVRPHRLRPGWRQRWIPPRFRGATRRRADRLMSVIRRFLQAFAEGTASVTARRSLFADMKLQHKSPDTQCTCCKFRVRCLSCASRSSPGHSRASCTSAKRRIWNRPCACSLLSPLASLTGIRTDFCMTHSDKQA